MALVVLSGGAVVAHSTFKLLVEPIDTQWVVIAVLTLLTGSFSVKVASINARISVSETFVFVAVLLYGTAAGTMTVLLEALVVLFWMSPAGRPLHRLFFNLAAPAVAIWISGSIFFLSSPIVPYSVQPSSLSILSLPLAGFTALYFLLNSWLVAFVVGLETKQAPSAIWWEKFTWLSVNYFSGASVAALIVTFMRDLNLSTLTIIVPLLVVSYLTFRTAMDRVEDSNKHLSELNRLHLSTIEALAMAIDAKDQITHGHIRRVQSFAVTLAKHLGMADEKHIKAVEAAALLHDMGKLAIPEYILNKPGKLTDAEFEKMKLHVTVGAEILSSIEFPYPVVPIVRHHHENWDGSGYPDGVKGTDIPIGARILSVVDCFDALTSDRPYRPKLSDDDALRILAERRGTMYDPLVVDTFIRIQRELAPRNSFSTSEPAITSTPHPSSRGLRGLERITSSADEMLTVYELATALAGQASLAETGDVIGKYLKRLVPAAQIALFLYDARSNELEIKFALGDASSILSGVRIPLGERLSGWVAANRQTIINSDPALDLGEIARSATPRLRSCLSTPLVADEQLVGVLAMYASSPQAFSDDQRRIVEVVARHLGPTLKASIEGRDGLSKNPTTVSPIELLLRVSDSENLAVSGDLSLLLIEILGSERDGILGSGDHTEIDKVAHKLCASLRPTDLLFKCSDQEYVVLLNDTESREAQQLARDLQSRLQASRELRDHTWHVRTRIRCVSAPKDGASLRELFAAIRDQDSRPARAKQIH